MPTLIERFGSRVARSRFGGTLLAEERKSGRRMIFNVKSFCVLAQTGQMWFVEANRVKVDRDGRLKFLTGFGHIVAVVAAGTWARVCEGISLEDFEEEGSG